MSRLSHSNELSVLLDGTPVGALANGPAGKVYFEYDASWLASGFALSPVPAFGLKRAAFPAASPEFGGLHGVFNDSLPDGWGLLLMDRALKRTAGWSPRDIGPLDRLAYIGDRGMGALEYQPVLEALQHEEAGLSLAALAEAAMQVDEGATGDILQSLHLQGGSPGGARPKITIALSADGNRCYSGFRNTPDGYGHWIVKFRASGTDPLCVGRIEMAYADMAKAAGIEMPECRLLTVPVQGQPQDYFAVRRFDREGNRKKHVLSIGGMLEASHRVPSLDYDGLLDAILFATRDVREVEKAFRLMVFNVLAHNKDDHVKNFSILWTGNRWAMTPAYDLTFSTSLNNEHMTAINGSGNPAWSDIRALAKNHGVKSAERIVEEVLSAVRLWPEFAGKWHVEPDIISNYQTALVNGVCRNAMER